MRGALDTTAMQSLFPERGEVSVAGMWDLSTRRRHGDRPWIVMCMISSADGAIHLDGSAAALGGPIDKELFLHLHRTADSVLVGAGTVRADGYHPLPPGRNLYVVSRTGNLGPHAAELRAASNTHVVAGDVSDIVRRIEGNVCALEGGSQLNAQMLAAGLVDEVSLTIAPRFVGSVSDRVASGPPAAREPWQLVRVCEGDDGFLFMRYVRSGAVVPS